MEATAATTVETTATHATTEAAAHVAVNTAGKSASNCGSSAVGATVTRASITVTRAPIDRSPIEAPAVAIVATAESAAEPGAGADEDAATEPRWTIVAIGCAGVGVIPVVAVGANRGIPIASTIHRAANPNANRNLGMRVSRCGEQQNTEYSEIA